MEIRDTPLAVAEAFAAAWNDYDAEALAGLFVEDAEFEIGRASCRERV